MSISRRSILLGTAAGLATTATTLPLAIKAGAVREAWADTAGPARQQAEADGAIFRLAREIKACRDRAEAIDRRVSLMSYESIVERRRFNRECDSYIERAAKLEDTMLDLPAGTLAGVLAKFCVWYGDDEIEIIRHGREPDTDGLPEQYAGSIFRDLERLIGRVA